MMPMCQGEIRKISKPTSTIQVKTLKALANMESHYLESTNRVQSCKQ
jgi:hypothetical protein